MSIASDHSKQFIHLETKMQEMTKALRILVERTEANINTHAHATTQDTTPGDTQIAPRTLDQIHRAQLNTDTIDPMEQLREYV